METAKRSMMLRNIAFNNETISHHRRRGTRQKTTSCSGGKKKG